MRPWTQGDIGDFVKANFAEEIGKRHKQVASAVHRTQSGAVPSRATMPLIAHDEGPSYDVESDDHEFPSVETDVDSAPQFVVTTTEQPVSDPFGHSTPPPFAAESTGSAMSLQPLTQAPPVVVVGKRSILWPILAVSMILVAGGALFLVWRQMQNQQNQQAPAPIIVTQEPSHEATRDAEAAEPGSAAPQAGSGSAAVEVPVPKHVPKHYPTYQAALNAALAGQKGSLTQCLIDHGNGVKDEMLAEINIGSSGKARSVQISPPALNASPVGACIRNVLMATPFPATPKDSTISVPLKPKSS
jgi:hypothetical protein